MKSKQNSGVRIIVSSNKIRGRNTSNVARRHGSLNYLADFFDTDETKSRKETKKHVVQASS